MEKRNNYQSNRRNNNNNGSKPSKYLTVGMSMSDSLDPQTKEEALKVLTTTKFNKLSITISAYRADLSSEYDADDGKLAVVGYIKAFDPETNTFKVSLSGKNKEIVMKFENPTIYVDCLEYNNRLSYISKFVISPK